MGSNPAKMQKFLKLSKGAFQGSRVTDNGYPWQATAEKVDGQSLCADMGR